MHVYYRICLIGFLYPIDNHDKSQVLYCSYFLQKLPNLGNLRVAQRYRHCVKKLKKSYPFGSKDLGPQIPCTPVFKSFISMAKIMSGAFFILELKDIYNRTLVRSIDDLFVLEQSYFFHKFTGLNNSLNNATNCIL